MKTEINRKKEKLKELHNIENSLNKEINMIDKEIQSLKSKKSKLAKRISNNMKFRNKIISELYDLPIQKIFNP